MISESDAPMSPQEASPMKPAMSVLGIDMAKRVLHVVGMDERGKIVWRKRLSRHDLIPEKRTDERPVTPTARCPPGDQHGLRWCGRAAAWADGRRWAAQNHGGINPTATLAEHALV